MKFLQFTSDDGNPVYINPVYVTSLCVSEGGKVLLYSTDRDFYEPEGKLEDIVEEIEEFLKER